MKKLTIIAILLLGIVLVSCAPTAVKGTTNSASSFTPSFAASNTPAPVPSGTPTLAPTVSPTPMGGRNGLLLTFNGSTLWEAGKGFRSNLDLIYIYNANSQRNKLLLEGYSCIGVSPDGKKIALRKTENGKTDLFVMDLAKPEEIVLLFENVFNPNVLSDDSYWFPNSEWIGFIGLKNGIPQIFVIHADGSNLTQVTKSAIGAIGMEPVFHEGIYWSEGTKNKQGQANIKNYKWTKMDGTEQVLQNFVTVSPSGGYIIRSMKPQNPACPFCDYVLGDPVTGETKEISLVKPKPDIDYPKVQPLSDDKWLVQWVNKNGDGRTAEYWIYSSDGKPLFAFADLPHEHAALPVGADNVDAYKVIFKNSTNLPVTLSSPDGNLLLIKHEIRTYLKKNFIDKYDVNYYTLNLSTYEIQPIAGLTFDRNNIPGPNQGFFWVELN